MAQISVEVGANAPRIVNAICGNRNYQATIDGQPNPQTKGQFATEVLKAFFRDEVRAWEANKAADDARKAAVDEVDAEVVI